MISEYYSDDELINQLRMFFNEEERERRQELTRLEQKLAKKEESFLQISQGE